MQSFVRNASKLLLVGLFLALASAALASNTWYVDGVNGNDNNECKTPQTSRSLRRGTLRVAPAIYTENLTISISLNIFGSNATTTIVDGGGIGTVFVISSTTANVKFSKLTIRNGHGNYGGGIYSVGTLTINNSTISGNSASFGGGGIELSHGASATINNSTITANTVFSYDGGGIVSYDIASATFQNSILANNTGGNCSGTTISTGYNLSSDGTCSFNGAGDMNNTDARLGTLGNQGGPTQTIPLLEGSPAMDAGNPNGCTDGKGHLLRIDQRGYPRPDKEDNTGCDMGAYERQSD